MRVLLIDSDSTTSKAIEWMLTSQGFSMRLAELGEEGMELAKSYDYDAILLELKLPDMQGFEVLHKLRSSKIETPLMILSSQSEVGSKIRSFSAGADDFISKPFHREELVARIHSVVRRAKGMADSIIRSGKLIINLDAKTVEVDGNRVHLTTKEYTVLEILALRRGTTLSKEMLLDHLYADSSAPDIKIVDVFVCKLRKKICAAGGGENYIETVWGHGYSFRDTKIWRVSPLHTERGFDI